MKLQKQESRKLRGKKYDKWVITIPPIVIDKLGWKEGEELKIQQLSAGLLVYSATLESKGEIIEYKETVPRTEKYSPQERFLKIYDNLPFQERKEVVVVINNEPISWNIARNNIIHMTELGKKILKKLSELEII